MTTQKHTSQSIADDLASKIQPGELLIAKIIAHVYHVNCNAAGHALRRLVKAGLLVKAYKSCAGNWVYRVPVKTTTVKETKFLVVAGSWDMIPSYTTLVQTLN